ncbi:hypothetical protein LCI18_002887 [Fusarium solani-melongenae]|uniref:Uncharacterized protein n=1 Tax=Fusarium solani subsp. cucurbitae TaxID=2747967 RepID=A0ACD3YSH9_FUSSC|nr:hypothetical protein LCI18_002887 [Fusarium solani-melongenae]
MPRKNRIPASAAQNRENQRRSRERHRQFVEDLQQRLQNYERRGVEASVEMQRVARAIAWENKHLRSLLDLRGVSQDEVDHHLLLAGPVGSVPNLNSRKCLQNGSDSSLPYGQSVREQLDPSPGDTTADFPPPPSTPSSNSSSLTPAELMEASISTKASPPNATPSSATVEAVDRSVTTNRDDKKYNSLDAHATENGQCVHTSSMYNYGWTELGTQTDILPQITECFCPLNSPGSISGHWDKGLSCEAAVEIISGLQKTLDSDRIRHLLHCKEADDCLVQNSSVFQIIDAFA